MMAKWHYSQDYESPFFMMSWHHDHIWFHDFSGLQNQKLAPYGDWWSTLRNWRLCQLQSHTTQKLGRISKIQPDKIQILCPSLRIHGQLPAAIINGEGDSFWKSQISNSEGLMILTLDRVILHIIVHHSLTSTYMPNFIEIDKTFCGQKDVRKHMSCIRMYAWTDGRTDGRTFETCFIRVNLKFQDL